MRWKVLSPDARRVTKDWPGWIGGNRIRLLAARTVVINWVITPPSPASRRFRRVTCISAANRRTFSSRDSWKARCVPPKIWRCGAESFEMTTASAALFLRLTTRQKPSGDERISPRRRDNAPGRDRAVEGQNLLE